MSADRARPLATRLESPNLPLPRLAEVAAHAGGDAFANGLAAFVFSATGPVAIILAVAKTGGLDDADIASWFLAAFGVGGLFSIGVCYAYRQPLTFGLTLPGAVLVGPALTQFTMGDVVGAYMATGLVILALTLTGTLRWVSARLPAPIVMAMVAGVFLPFGIGLVKAFDGALGLAAAMVGAWLLSASAAAIGRRVPPVLAALIAGAVVVALEGTFAPKGGLASWLVEPVLRAPALDLRALVELVVPLTVTVVGIHNTQGFAVVRNAGYEPPETVASLICGAGSLVYGVLGCVPTVVTGPSNAILNSSGPLAWRYIGGIWFGIWSVLFGVFAPVMVAVAVAVPGAFIALLAGLAMVPVLRTAFVVAFRGPFAMGALVTFLVTVAGISIFHIGAAFWGLVIGYAVSRIVEPADFERLAAGG